MSRTWAAAILALVFAGSAGSGLLAMRNNPQESDTQKASPDAVANDALHSGLKRLEKADQIALKNVKQSHKEYEAALKDFQLAPASSKTIEYSAKAYMGLHRLSDAKQAYMHLFVHDRTASHILMKAMKAWVENQRTRPASVDRVDNATLEAFDSWVRERDTLAGAVVNLGHNSPDWK